VVGQQNADIANTLHLRAVAMATDVSHKLMNVDGRKNVDGETAWRGHSVRNIPLDKLKALMLSKAELILSTLSDNILNSMAASKGELFFDLRCLS